MKTLTPAKERKLTALQRTWLSTPIDLSRKVSLTRHESLYAFYVTILPGDANRDDLVGQADVNIVVAPF